MKILRADHLGMCFGVRDALALALAMADRQPVTILGDLVHNPTVLAALQARGIGTASDPGRVKTPTAMITAHGASDRRRSDILRHGLNLLDATCPLVRVAHRAVARLAAEGCHPVIVGQRHHVEVRGLTEDLAAFDVVLEDADVDALAERPRFGVAAQTTQPVDRVRRLVARLRQRFPASEVRFIDTVCQPTKLRQHAAVDLAQRCDVVIVVGGAHSNNTRELVATCRRHCARVHHVQTAAELDPGWLAGAGCVGLTAGTSTPDATISDVERRLSELAAVLERRALPEAQHAF
jgi:4-hydroxy-3-methylbut-2-enyl diphosphate reductase